MASVKYYRVESVNGWLCESQRHPSFWGWIIIPIYHWWGSQILKMCFSLIVLMFHYKSPIIDNPISRVPDLGQLLNSYIKCIYIVLNTALCDNVCQWLATGLWFSPGSNTNKTDHHWNIVKSGVKHHNHNPWYSSDVGIQHKLMLIDISKYMILTAHGRVTTPNCISLTSTNWIFRCLFVTRWTCVSNGVTIVCSSLDICCTRYDRQCSTRNRCYNISPYTLILFCLWK